MGCEFCHKSWVQGCWSAAEAANCGNMDAATIDNLKKSAKAIADIERRRRGPTKAQIEKLERAELARLKAKYET